MIRQWWGRAAEELGKCVLNPNIYLSKTVYLGICESVLSRLVGPIDRRRENSRDSLDSARTFDSDISEGEESRLS